MALENILSQEIVQKLGWTLLHFVWQAAAVALFLSILLALLRKSTANLRYIVACAALGLIVLLPIVTMLLVGVSTPQPIAGIEPPSAPAIMPAQPITEEVLPPKIAEYVEPIQPDSISPAKTASWKQRVIERLEPALSYLVTGWLIGVFGISLWHLGGWAQLQRLRKKMVKQVDESVQSRLNRLSEKLHLKRAVQLLESALVQVPTVIGWLRPVILLPASALMGLTTEQLEALLAHELAHVRRYDYLVNMLQTIVETLGFYHPAVWWVSHRIRAERENCCDDLAVSISGDRIRYARALTSMEEIRAGRSELAVAATGGSLFERIRRIVGKDSNGSSRASWIPSAITILLIAIIAIPTILALNSQAEEKINEELKINEGSIEGRIIDINNGKGISGVQLAAVPNFSGESNKRFTFTSEEDGTFSISSLQSGEYRLQGDFPSVDVGVISGRSTKDILIGIRREQTTLPHKEMADERQSNGQIMIGSRMIQMPVDAVKEAFGPNEDFSSGLLFRQGHEIAGRLLTIARERKDAKLLAIPQMLLNNNSDGTISIIRKEFFIHHYEPNENEQGKLAPQLKPLDIGWKFKIFAEILEDDEQVHIKLVTRRQKSDFETLQYRPGYDYQIPSPPEIFATDFIAKNGEPVVIGRITDDKTSYCLIVTPSLILPERQSEPLLGKKLPQPDNIQNIDSFKQADGKWILVCFWDMNQRPSRNLIEELAKRDKELAGKNIAVLLVDTSNIEPAKLKEWLDNRNIPFPCGSIIKDNAKDVLIRWGVQAQPWLILTDENKIVQTEGLNLEQLDEKLRETSPAAQVKGDNSIESEQEQTMVSNVPKPVKSVAPASTDKSIVRIDLSVVEVSSDSKLDKKTTTEIKNLLADKITLPDSPAVVDLLRKATEATAAVKDESGGDKRVTQMEFNTLFDLLTSRGFVKILMRPTLEVVDGETAKILSGQKIPLDRPTMPPTQSGNKETKIEYEDVTDSIQITPHVSKDGNIILLQIEAAFSSYTMPKDDEQTPIINRHEIATLIRLGPWESGIIGGVKQTGLITEPGKETKNLEVPVTEILVILTPIIVETTGSLLKQPHSLVGSDLPRFQELEIAVRPDDLKGRKTLLCFWDMNQRPSRNLINELTKRKKELSNKNVAVYLVHASKIDSAQLKEWLDNRNISFACGSITDNADEVLFHWGVRAQPWLILTDENRIVHAEGFSLEQLDEKLQEKGPDLPLEEERSRDNLRTEESTANSTRVYHIYDLVLAGERISRGAVDVMMDGSGVGLGSHVNIPDQAVANEAQKIANLIMQTVEPNSWYENNPNALGTISPFPAARPRKLAIYQILHVHQQIEKFLESQREQIITTQISIELRYLYTNLDFLDEVRDSMDIEFTSDTLLDDKQVETLLRASQKNRNIKSLTAPRAMVLNNETARFSIVKHIFMSFLDFSEPDNRYQQSPPVPINTFCRITPHIEDNNNIIIDFVQDIPGLQECIIYDRREMAQSYTETSAITNKRIPNNKTFAFTCDLIKFDPYRQSALSAEKKTLIVLIKPTIIVQEEMPRKEPARSLTLPRIDPNNPLLKKLEEQFKRYDDRKKDKNQTKNQTNAIYLNPLPTEQPGTGKSQIMFDIKILTASDEFMKYIGLDPNSVANSEDWLDYLVHSTEDSASFVIDQLHADSLLRNVAARMQTYKDIQMFHGPEVLALSGMKLKMHITDLTDSEHYIIHGKGGLPDSNIFSVEPESESNPIELGTTIRMIPTLTPDGKNIELDFEWEYRRLRGVKEHTGPDGKVQKVPQIDVDSIKTPCTIPDGKTLLIAGKKIIEQKKRNSGKFGLADIPLIGRFFYSPAQPEKTRNLLIMVTPSTDIKEPSKPQSLQPLHSLVDPNDPLIKKLEEKFNRYDEQK